LPPQRSDIGRLGNPPCDQPTHFTPQVLQGGPSNGKPTTLNSPGFRFGRSLWELQRTYVRTEL